MEGKTLQIRGCIKELSDQAKNKFEADYVLFVELSEGKIISTLVSDEIFVREEDRLTVNGDFTKIEFRDLEINDIANQNRHGQEFDSIQKLLKEVTPQMTYTVYHTDYMIF